MKLNQQLSEIEWAKGYTTGGHGSDWINCHYKLQAGGHLAVGYTNYTEEQKGLIIKLNETGGVEWALTAASSFLAAAEIDE